MLKGTVTALLAAVQTRLALLGNEIEVGKLHLLHQIQLILAFVFCIGLALLMLLGLALAVWWDNRVTILALGVVACGLWGAYLYHAWNLLAARSEPVFSVSLAELQEDLRQLRAVSSDEQNAR